MTEQTSNVGGLAPRRQSGFVFYFTYKILGGTTPIHHEIPCDLNAPVSLVIAVMAGANHVSIMVAPGDRREWLVTEIVSLKFGFGS